MAEMNAKRRGSPTPAQESVRGRSKDPSTRGPKQSGRGGQAGKDEKNPPRSDAAVSAKRVGIAGVPGSKNPERRCTATANRTGERCKRAAIKGGTVCTTHGGKAPQVQKAAKQRLMELVDPFITELRRIVLDPDTDDSVKVRGIVAVLDRTGHGPNAKITVGVSKWDAIIEDIAEQVQVDRSLPADDRPALDSGGGGSEHTWEDVATFQADARSEAWSEYDRDDDANLSTRLDPYDGRTVKGEVVEPGEGPSAAR